MEAKLISDGELRRKQANVVETFANIPWKNVPEFQAVVERLMALKRCNWLSEMDFHTKKVELLRKVDQVEDYVSKVELYISLPKIGIISESEYEQRKQKFIEEIFGEYSTMDEFQVKAKKLMDLQKTGMLSEDEYNSYKMKLMSEL